MFFCNSFFCSVCKPSSEFMSCFSVIRFSVHVWRSSSEFMIMTCLCMYVDNIEWMYVDNIEWKHTRFVEWWGEICIFRRFVQNSDVLHRCSRCMWFLCFPSWYDATTLALTICVHCSFVRELTQRFLIDCFSFSLHFLFLFPKEGGLLCIKFALKVFSLSSSYFLHAYDPRMVVLFQLISVTSSIGECSFLHLYDPRMVAPFFVTSSVAEWSAVCSGKCQWRSLLNVQHDFWLSLLIDCLSSRLGMGLLYCLLEFKLKHWFLLNAALVSVKCETWFWLSLLVCLSSRLGSSKSVQRTVISLDFFCDWFSQKRLFCIFSTLPKTTFLYFEKRVIFLHFDKKILFCILTKKNTFLH